MSAAAPLPPELLEQVSAKLKVAIKQAYGLSETSPGITYQVRDSLRSCNSRLAG